MRKQKGVHKSKKNNFKVFDMNGCCGTITNIGLENTHLTFCLAGETDDVDMFGHACYADELQLFFVIFSHFAKFELLCKPLRIFFSCCYGRVFVV